MMLQPGSQLLQAVLFMLVLLCVGLLLHPGKAFSGKPACGQEPVPAAGYRLIGCDEGEK
jgi:hypothetical protein